MSQAQWAVLSAAMLFALGGLAQSDREPSIHRPVSAEELERLKRQITEETRSSVELLGDYRIESGDLNDRLDLWRLGARLNYKAATGSLIYLSAAQTNYMTRDDRFGGRGTNLTLGLRRELSDVLRLQLEIGGTRFSTESSSINGLASLNYAPSDTENVYLTASRSNVEESLLSATGLRPTTGPFAGMLVGQVMENKAVVGALIKLPYKFDASAEAGLGTREGESTGSNLFKLARAGLGYEVLSGAEEKPLNFLRLAYLWHYFSFDEDRSGFVSPVPGPGNPGIGGYFSPQYFVSRTGRVDLAGRLSAARLYRASAFYGEQVYTGSAKRDVYGASVTLEHVLSDRTSIPVSLQRDNLGPFTQRMFSVKLVIKL
jgi:hypothetical protein